MDNRAFTLVRTLELVQTRLRVIDLVRTFEHARQDLLLSLLYKVIVWHTLTALSGKEHPLGICSS
jgi:hypothetical protein